MSDPDTVNVHVKAFPAELWLSFRVLAIRRGMSLREQLIDALRAYMKGGLP